MGLPADRVDRMEVYSCPLTYAHGTYVMSANRTITTLESTVVVLRTTDGVSGYGEICPLGSTYLPRPRPVPGPPSGRSREWWWARTPPTSASCTCRWTQRWLVMATPRARSTLPLLTCSATLRGASM